jgi:soluble lytic murein transglycosylase-like protein
MPRVRALALAALAAAAAPAAMAQVIEIGADGATVTYAEPTRFSADGAEPVRVRADPPLAAAPAPAPVVAPDAGALSDPLSIAARANGLPPALLRAVAWRESRGRQDAVSPKGAIGVMQLMPATAAELGVDPRDLLQNLAGGAAYLRRQLDAFGSVPLALAAYNAGPGAVRRFGGIPPYAETRAYVRSVMAMWRPEHPPAAAWDNP